MVYVLDITEFEYLGGLEGVEEGYNYKKAGVIVMGLTPNNETQLSFFNASNPWTGIFMSLAASINKKNQLFTESRGLFQKKKSKLFS